MSPEGEGAALLAQLTAAMERAPGRKGLALGDAHARVEDAMRSITDARRRLAAAIADARAVLDGAEPRREGAAR